MGTLLQQRASAAAAPAAKTLVKRACTLINFSGKQLGKYVAQLSIACAKAGDFQPFQDYAAWLKTTTPEQLDFSRMDCLEPLLRFPTNGGLGVCGRGVALATPIRPGANCRGKEPLGVISSNPIWRQFRPSGTLLIRELEKTNVCGSMTWRGSGVLEYQITDSQSGTVLCHCMGLISPPLGRPPAFVGAIGLIWSLSLKEATPIFQSLRPR